MVWYIISAIFFAAAVVLLIWNYLRDRRYVKMKTSQAMRPQVWGEIEEEKKEIEEKRELFLKALQKAKESGGKTRA